MSIRNTDYTGAEIIELLSSGGGASDGVITLGNTTGRIRLYIPADLTRAMSFTNAVYDIELSPGGYNPDTGTDTIHLLKGRVVLEREVNYAA